MDDFPSAKNSGSVGANMQMDRGTAGCSEESRYKGRAGWSTSLTG
jgi:hypothetical protein